MTYMQAIKKYQQKPSKFSPSEIIFNIANMKTIYAIGAFEGVKYSKETKILYNLIAQGRITAQEAAKLVIKYA